MNNRLEVLVPFLVAIITLLGYIAWLLRKIIGLGKWLKVLPAQHAWLMATVTQHSKQLDELLKLVAELITRKDGP